MCNLRPTDHHTHRQLRSALEAEVDIVLPNDVDMTADFVQLLHRER
jgi:hypothetical protein